jgi:hypothetical protein
MAFCSIFVFAPLSSLTLDCGVKDITFKRIILDRDSIFAAFV